MWGEVSFFCIALISDENIFRYVFLGKNVYSGDFPFLIGFFVCFFGIYLYEFLYILILSSVQFSCSVVSDSLRPNELQHARPPCLSPTPGVYSNPCPSSRWYHPTSHPLSSPSPPASNPSQHQGLFQRVNSSHEVAKVLEFQLPMNIQGWSPLGWTGWISLQSKGLSRVFSNTTVQKHQFFSAQLSSQSNSHIHTWPLEKS